MGIGPDTGLKVVEAASESGPWSVVGLVIAVALLGSTFKVTKEPTAFGIDLSYYNNAWVHHASNPAALLPSFILAAAIGAVLGSLLGAAIASLRGK